MCSLQHDMQVDRSVCRVNSRKVQWKKRDVPERIPSHLAAGAQGWFVKTPELLLVKLEPLDQIPMYWHSFHSTVAIGRAALRDLYLPWTTFGRWHFGAPVL